jgi:hypothetical protein
VQCAFEQLTAVDCSIVNLGFQKVTHGHQIFDFGDDAVLFGERREGNWQLY